MSWGKILGAAAAAALAYILADKGVKSATGKHIHEHVFEWYREFTRSAETWARQHPEHAGCRFVLALVEVSHRTVSMCKAALYAITGQERRKKIQEDEIPLDEARKMGLSKPGDEVSLELAT